MTVVTQATREAQRIQRRAGTQSDEVLRDASLAHQEARRGRLQAYVDSLQAALDASPTSAQAVRLADRLALATRDALAAARRRVPTGRGQPAPAPTGSHR